jgi:L-alanine-DL-glutamate epimerase-like enolase superfamily enzyme
MKITDVRFHKVTGLVTEPQPSEEEGQVWALNVYPRHRYREISYVGPVDQEHPRRVESLRMVIETDQGITGETGIGSAQARIIHGSMLKYLIGEDPIANERIWDIIKRSNRSGHRGLHITALASVDFALWDIRGKAMGMPVYRLLGGPTRDRIPAYVSALGQSLELEKAYVLAQAFKQQGFCAQKWFFKYGPADGRAGMQKNLDLVRTLREAVGHDIDLMFDAFQGWDVPYAIEMCRRMESYNPRWLEEPVQVDRVASYAEIKRATSVPIAGGEHENTRWGFKVLLDAEALDVVQPDLGSVGGLTEAIKVVTLASAYDKPAIPHWGGVHLVASQSPAVCPLFEYGYTWFGIGQWLKKHKTIIEDGFVLLPDQPGMGNELDETRVLSLSEWVPS